MKRSASTHLLLSLLTLAHRAASSPYPNLQWDPDTAADCVEWYDNMEGKSCEYVRSYFTMTPEQFHAWNPSLGLDCSGWRDATSYCIVTLGRLQDTYKSRSITNAVTTRTISLLSTTTTTTYTATPTIWRPIGCYASDPPLDSRVSVSGKLTPAGCQRECYSSQHLFAGLQAGNQCWCSPSVPGDELDGSKCNVPCEGDSGATCGGMAAVEVFLKEVFPPLPSSLSRAWVTTGTSGSEATATAAPGAVSGGVVSGGVVSGGAASGGGGGAAATAVETKASSGAARKRALFGMLG